MSAVEELSAFWKPVMNSSSGSNSQEGCMILKKKALQSLICQYLFTCEHNTNTPEHLNLHTILIQAWMFISKPGFIEIFSVTTGKYWDSNFKFPSIFT